MSIELTGEKIEILYRRVPLMVRNRIPSEDAEDVSQDAIISIYENIANLQDESKYNAWVAAVVRNKIADYYRRRARAVKSSAPVEFDSSSGSVKQDQFGCELADLVCALPNHYQEIINLYIRDSYTMPQAAQQLGISINAAWGRFKRAKAKLREEKQSAETNPREPRPEEQIRNIYGITVKSYPKDKLRILLAILERKQGANFPALCGWSATREAVFALRWGVDDGVYKTQERVGGVFGITDARVCQIEAEAFELLGIERSANDKDN